MTYFLLGGLLKQFGRSRAEHAGEMAVGVTNNDKAIAENTQPLEVLQLKHLHFVTLSGVIMHDREWATDWQASSHVVWHCW
jgi:hypothetical protein